MKRIALIVILCMLALSANSQNLWQSVVVWLKSTSAVDSGYIYQRPARFSVDGNFNMKNFIVDINSKYTLKVDNSTVTTPATESAWVPAKSTMSFSGGVKNGLGVGVGYGNLGLGYSFNIGANDKKSSSSFNFALRGHKWGVGVNFLWLNHYAHSRSTIDSEGSQWYRQETLVSSQPCDVFRMSLDAYWTLNRGKFAYTAAYKCGMVQRRSAGSFLIGGNLLLYGVFCDENDDVFVNTGLKDYFFTQASVGAGYSYNMVLLHRDPTGPNSAGLRNVTLNATLLPLLNWSNGIYVTPHGEKDAVRLSCPISPNLNGSVAVSYSLGRMFFSLQYAHNLLYFRNDNDWADDDEIYQTNTIKDFTFNVLAQDWSMKAMVVYNF